MTRGEVWAAAGSGYLSKPRPVLILQDDAFSGTDSITVVPFTTDPTVAPLIRLAITPNDENNLSQPCSLMIDKIVTTPREKVRQYIGKLPARQMAEVSRMVTIFLGITRGLARWTRPSGTEGSGADKTSA